MSFRSRALQALALSMILALSACGGGGDESSITSTPSSTTVSSGAANLEDRLKPFLGKWASCVPVGNTSEKDEFTAVSAGGAKATITRSYTQYTGTGCVGTGVLLIEEESDLTLTGQTLAIANVATAEIFDRDGQITVYTDSGPGQRTTTKEKAPTSIAAVIGDPNQMLVETFPGDYRTYLKQP